MSNTFTKNSGIREYVYVMSFQTGFVQSVQVLVICSLVILCFKPNVISEHSSTSHCYDTVNTEKIVSPIMRNHIL